MPDHPARGCHCPEHEAARARDRGRARKRPNYTGPRGDDVPICEQCGQRHLTIHRTQACAGHVTTDRASYVPGQPRTPLPEPRPCGTFPRNGSTVCVNHGASAPHVAEAAASREAEDEITAAARKLIPDVDDRTPIRNPLERLLELASEADAFRESLRLLANKLNDDIRAGGPSEHLRAEVATYRQALKDTTDMLVAIARLDIEKMLARVEARKVDLLITALTAGLGEAGLDSEQKRAVIASVGRHLRSVPRAAS